MANFSTRIAVKPRQNWACTWPLQDIVLLQSFSVEVCHPLIAPATCKAYLFCNTIARPLRDIRPPTDPPLRDIRPLTDPPLLCHTPYNIGDDNIV